MRSAKTLMATLAVVAGAASPALAEWRWVEDAPARTETYVYEAPTTYYQYQQQPRTYYQPQQPRTYYRETYTPVVVTDRQVFQDGRCEVTRTFLSDGTSTDERLCSRRRLVLPHEYIIDRVGRRLDRWRGYE